MWAEFARRERAAHPDPDRKRDVIRGLAITADIYSTLGLAFYIGWHQAGVAAG